MRSLYRPWFRWREDMCAVLNNNSHESSCDEGYLAHWGMVWLMVFKDAMTEKYGSYLAFDKICSVPWDTM